MWIRKPKYPVKENLPEIERHDLLPTGCVEITKIPDSMFGNEWLFIKNNGSLSIVNHKEKTLTTGEFVYICKQRDFPMEFLSWFSSALTEFRKPPIEGGLPAGAMTSADQEVGGEMLCIQRAMAVTPTCGGYAVLNRSRCEFGYDVDSEFSPHEVIWSDKILFDDGLLDLIKDLGEQFEQGKI